jgi:hypothetical protein
MCPSLCGRYRSPHFGFRILHGVERIVGRSDTAAAHYLDLAGTKHKLFTHPAKHFGLAIGNRRNSPLLCDAKVGLRHPRQIGPHAEIAMSRSLRNHGTRGVNARARNAAFIDRAL